MSWLSGFISFLLGKIVNRHKSRNQSGFGNAQEAALELVLFAFA